MSRKKTLFLTLALLLPVGTFLFLKFFGKNKFEVPLLHQQPVVATADCPYTYPAPYVLADSIMRAIQGTNESKLYVLNYSSDRTVLNTITNEFTPAEVSIINGKSALTMADFEKCVLLKPDNADLVLVDNENRIRGYYEAADLDELDRMVVEMKILVEKY